MTATCFYKRTQTARDGILAAQIPLFSEALRLRGYSAISNLRHVSAARHFVAWMSGGSLVPEVIDDAMIIAFACHACANGGSGAQGFSPAYMGRVRAFVRYLAQARIVTRPVAPLAPGAARIAAFQDWLKVRCAVSDQTIRSHTFKLNAILAVLGRDTAYDAAGIRRAIIAIAAVSSRFHTKNLVATLRHYLRFLAERGECPVHLAEAIPTLSARGTDTLPRHLAPDRVEALIDACDLATSAGKRDRAVLLLLARLGLRAGDIVAMRLDAVAWDEGAVRVCGKGRREVKLPLPQDVGDALFAYLQNARPVVADDRLFLRTIPPFVALASSPAVAHIVKRALQRADITDAPSRGAHMLRHSAATGLLRAGATMESIAAILRHRSVETTNIYARVDVGMLGEIAQPWPGATSC
jgi:site-specific recombinase XerD